MRLRTGVVLAAWSCSAAAAGAQSVDDTIDRAVAAWSHVRTVRGTFDQTVTNPLTGSSGTAHGTYAQERPNRLAIRFQSSDDAIVSDGRAVWVYLPSATPGKVIKRPATDRGSVPLDLTGQFLDAPRTKYGIAAAGTRAVDGHATHALTLVPRAAASGPFTTATVWIDDDDSLIREFEETERNGVVRHVHLTSVEPNVSIDRRAFVFDVPAGVKIVDQSK